MKILNDFIEELNNLSPELRSSEDVLSYLHVEEGKLKVCESQRKLHPGVDDKRLDTEIQRLRQVIDKVNELANDKENWEKELKLCEEECAEKRKKKPPLPPLVPTVTCPPCRTIASELDKTRGWIQEVTQEIDELKSRIKNLRIAIKGYEKEQKYQSAVADNYKKAGSKVSKEDASYFWGRVEEVALQLQRQKNELEKCQKMLADCNADNAAFEQKKAELDLKLRECEKKCKDVPAMEQPLVPVAPGPTGLSPAPRKPGQGNEPSASSEQKVCPKTGKPIEESAHSETSKANECKEKSGVPVPLPEFSETTSPLSPGELLTTPSVNTPVCPGTLNPGTRPRTTDESPYPESGDHINLGASSAAETDCCEFTSLSIRNVWDKKQNIEVIITSSSGTQSKVIFANSTYIFSGRLGECLTITVKSTDPTAPNLLIEKFMVCCKDLKNGKSPRSVSITIINFTSKPGAKAEFRQFKTIPSA